MERNITLSPEALPYWNMIKDASPKVRDELKVFLINVSVSGAMKSYEENTEKEHLGKYDTDPDTIAFLNDFAGAWSDMPGTTEEIIDSCESCRTMVTDNIRHFRRVQGIRLENWVERDR